MSDKPTKGGPVARQAAMLCQDRTFRLYLDRRRRHKFGLPEGDLPDGTHSEQDARDWICAACGIESRAELDHDTAAAAVFTNICLRYRNWKRRAQQ
ncbi:hypothetical protein SAMN05216571_106138 [Onishia taeanensis]|uniref:Uncharacterized protein n=1 Tax=Onishia taeanensis TaxID=284577 RepID=A0A1G7SFG7_9GAMM|nr:hypothetical protein [Halomonas taeanensis]SDG21807.1 hypothetical protein SAMN05216571_106138 [Halomonas taeanensis]